MPEKSSSEFVSELAIWIVFPYEVQKRREIVAVQLCHVCFSETLTELPQVRTGTDLFHQLFGLCVVFFVAARIVADEIYPRGATVSSGANQGAVVPVRREPYLDERVG